MSASKLTGMLSRVRLAGLAAGQNQKSDEVTATAIRPPRSGNPGPGMLDLQVEDILSNRGPEGSPGSGPSHRQPGWKVLLHSSKGLRTLKNSNLRKSASWVYRVVMPFWKSKAAKWASGTKLPLTTRPLVMS